MLNALAGLFQYMQSIKYTRLEQKKYQNKNSMKLKFKIMQQIQSVSACSKSVASANKPQLFECENCGEKKKQAAVFSLLFFPQNYYLKQSHSMWKEMAKKWSFSIKIFLFRKKIFCLQRMSEHETLLLFHALKCCSSNSNGAPNVVQYWRIKIFFLIVCPLKSLPQVGLAY